MFNTDIGSSVCYLPSIIVLLFPFDLRYKLYDTVLFFFYIFLFSSDLNDVSFFSYKSYTVKTIFVQIGSKCFALSFFFRICLLEEIAISFECDGYLPKWKGSRCELTLYVLLCRIQMNRVLQCQDECHSGISQPKAFRTKH